MHLLRQPLPGRPAHQDLPRLRQGPLPTLRPRRRPAVLRPGEPARPPPEHVALLRGHAHPRRVQRRHTRRGLHAPAQGRASGPRDGRAGHPHQGRGREPDRQLQGPRPLRRRVEGEGAWPHEAHHAVGGQRRRRAGRLRRQGGHRGPRLHAQGRARGQPHRGRGRRSPRHPRRRPHLRRGRDLTPTGRRARPVRRVHAAGAL